ncbi:type 4a pilus biogenesis protein PilO [Thermodesulfobacterium sp. TA1]|uniref:type 4a pilus biogenesis protein PilO n=1 Tax=Thermodesulfobacterium sp. TA1 TaxID=2234087 RepID=UPI0012325F63|nr:type 4a pilus biogenesis protein PilO [Thermodesulfobacterium sp. TA1]QER42266.1 type 4a pilus biogenesis protein PilO [Thermodesulfobacterium sp. TA1]
MKIIKVLTERIKTWDEVTPLRTKILVLIVLVLGPLALFYQFYYQPNKEKINILKEDINKLDLEIAKYSQVVTKLEFLNKQMAARKEFLEVVKNLFPDEKEIPIILKKVAELAKKNNLEIILFKPEKEVVKDYYQAIPITVELTGDFNNMIAFLNEIQKLPRLVVINELEFKIKDKRLTLGLNLSTFQYTGKPVENKEGKEKK